MPRTFTMRGRFVDGGGKEPRTTERRCDGRARFTAAPELGGGCWRWEPDHAVCTGDPNADALADDRDARAVCQDGATAWHMKAPAFFLAGGCVVSGDLARLAIECTWSCRHAECEGRATYTFAAAPACDQLFEPPAGAELLCDEHVLARDVEIHWRSYGVAEARAAVTQRYRERAASCNVGIVTKPPLFMLSQGDRRLETYEAGASGFPTCARPPGPGAKTVVIVSEKHDRKP
jgi:hypothetical protein